MVGRSMQAELETLERTLTTPERPLVSVIGGAKISTKLHKHLTPPPPHTQCSKYD